MITNIKQDVLVPGVEDIQGIDMPEVKWVLIIEKEVRILYCTLVLATHHTGRLSPTLKKQVLHASCSWKGDPRHSKQIKP